MDKIEYRASQMGMTVNQYRKYLADKDKGMNAMAHMVELSEKIRALRDQHQKYFYQLGQAMQNEKAKEDISDLVLEKYGYDIYNWLKISFE